MIFKEYVEIWQKEKQEFVKATTMSAYKLLIKKHLMPTFGEMEISLINNDIVSAFAFKKLDEGISKKSVQDIIICLKMIIKNAALKNLIEMPQIQVRYPKNTMIKKKLLKCLAKMTITE